MRCRGWWAGSRRISRPGRRRVLAEDDIRYLILDGWYPNVRIGRRRERVPVLVTLGVRGDGERVVLDVRLAGDESTAAWRDVIRILVDRHVGTPRLAMIDGSAGLAAALRTTNAPERIHGEFRRRTKTQASLPSQDAVLLLLFGLLRSGQVKMRKIDGWQEMERVKHAA